MRWIVLVSVVAVLAPACASDGSTTSGEVRSTSRAPSASPSPRQHLFVSGEPCETDESGLFGDPVGCVTRARGDFDDDVAEEELAVYARVDAEGFPASWHIALVDGNSVSSTRKVPTAAEVSYPAVIGATDFDGDGDDEAMVSVAQHPLHGIVGQDLALFAVGSDDRVHRIALEDGSPFKMTSFNIARLGEGARCEDVAGDDRREVIVTRLWSVDRQNKVWKWSERRYAWRGNALRYIGRVTGKLRVTDYNDPKLDPYFYVACDEVHVP